MFVSNVHYGVVVVADTVVDAMTSTVVDALAVVVACPELVCGELACGEPVESVEWVEPISSKSGLISSKQKIAIECDGAKSHSLLSQKIRDRAKDKFLRRAGWKILRFTEKEIIEKADDPEGSRGIDACILKLKSLLNKGGQRIILCLG